MAALTVCRCRTTTAFDSMKREGAKAKSGAERRGKSRGFGPIGG
ncbi:hypothetical protein GCWU000325_01981 [Alloprevotella tannerae ATCC 51259]|uniref:Uncharacterized protein n=1 Tax=Alloprevotella tannerae ATCC 51259 TaxID=626522 RepID=C9LIC3_9BACT|nr:hypothetical protein GCWU000325_01981 [Alloprevotella tannerae ATCC 51259]